MSKKDGLEIFELFRSGPPKSAPADPAPTPPPQPRERVAAVRPAPKPEPKVEVGRAEATVSVRLNTALFGLMIGVAGLFGTFALGVQFERRHHAATAAVEEPVKAAAEIPPVQLPAFARETRREPAPAPNPPQERPPAPAPAEPKKGWTLQLISYTPEQESTARAMLGRIQSNGGAETSLVRDRSNNFVVVAGFVEKQSGADAEALLAKYRALEAKMNRNFNLDWIGMTR